MSERRQLPIARDAVLSPEVLAGIAAGEASVTRAAVAKGGARGVLEAADLAAARAASLAAAARGRAPDAAARIACREGCAHCCHGVVTVFAPEVLRLAAHLRATLAPNVFAALVDSVRATDRVTRGLSQRERAERQIPCPLLDEDGACRGYAARPIVCAAWTSTDVGACERSRDDPTAPAAPVFVAGYEAANAVLAGLAKGCALAGLDAAPLELIAALTIALERESAADRYAERRPVFAPARRR